MRKLKVTWTNDKVRRREWGDLATPPPEYKASLVRRPNNEVGGRLPSSGGGSVPSHRVHRPWDCGERVMGRLKTANMEFDTGNCICDWVKKSHVAITLRGVLCGLQ